MSLQLISLTSLACTLRPFILFFQHAKLSPTTRPLHSQSTLSPTCDTHCRVGAFHYSPQLKCHFLREAFPDHLSRHSLSYHTISSIALTAIWNCLIYLPLNSLLSLTRMEAPKGHRLCLFCLLSTMGHNRPSVNIFWINRQKEFWEVHFRAPQSLFYVI